VQKSQGGQDTVARLRARDIATLGADGIGIERKAHGRDAREWRFGPAVGHQSGAGLRGLPEKIEGAFFDVLEQRIERPDGGDRQRVDDHRFDDVAFLRRRLAADEHDRARQEQQRSTFHAATGALQ
jgi:hypothetical protein